MKKFLIPNKFGKTRSKNYFLVLILWLTNNKKGGGGGVGARYKWSKKITFGKNSSMQKKNISDQGD